MWLLAVATFSTGCTGLSGLPAPVRDALKPIFPPTPSEAARDAFNVYDADARRESVAMLSSAKFGGEAPYQRMYRLLIDDPDATVRAGCIKALGTHGTAHDAKLITPRLEDEAAVVRWEAAIALQKIHDPGAVGSLIRVTGRDADADVRMAAAVALGQYAQRRVYHALVGALNDPSFGVVQAANQSLVILTGKDLGYDASQWLSWAQTHRDDLFTDRQTYVWQPYHEPPGLVDYIIFWKKRQVAQPQPPRGLEEEGAS